MAVRKLKIDQQHKYDYYAGSWSAAVSNLATHLHTPDGLCFVASVDAVMNAGKILNEPWVGVLHGVSEALEPSSLDKLRRCPAFSANMELCRGLWVLSEDVKQRVGEWKLPVPVSRINAGSGNLLTDGPARADRFTGLIGQITNSAIYRNLPTPGSQANEFRAFDLTVFIISYKRLQNIGRILASLCHQSYQGSFEVIIWNNNASATERLEKIIAPFRSVLEITIIHSSRNFYCVV